MKNIVLQHYTGTPGKLEELSMANISDYAKRVGADYQLVQGNVFSEHLSTQCQKLIMLDERYDEYDTVLMLDIDKFVTTHEKENVFDVPGIGLYEDVQRGLHKTISERMPEEANWAYPYWGGAIYKLGRSQRQYLRQGLKDGLIAENMRGKRGPNPYMYDDEGIMHVLAVKQRFLPQHAYLPRKWCYCSYLPNPENGGFIHIRTKVTPTGPKRSKMENLMALVEKGIITI